VSPKTLRWTILLALLALIGSMAGYQGARKSRRLDETRAAVASRVAAMQPTKEWTAEEVDRFRLDLPDEYTYDWIVISAKQSPEAYREWYARGNHRMRLPPDRRLEPAFARELLGQVAASLKEGDFENAGNLLRQVWGDMSMVPFHPRPPAR
jgi:hypothetical protein